VRFQPNQRLLTKFEFDTVFKNAIKVQQRNLMIYFKPNEKTTARLGLSIGKRFAKNAVTRNTIRRIIRESFRKHQYSLEGLDIIVLAKLHVDKLSKAELREGIEQLWQKLMKRWQNAA